MNKDFLTYDWNSFNDLSISEKVDLFNHAKKPYHGLMAQQFNRAYLDEILLKGEEPPPFHNAKITKTHILMYFFTKNTYFVVTMLAMRV